MGAAVAELGSWKGVFDGLVERHHAEPTWMVTRREAAMSTFERLGVPTQRLEDWKYTSTRGLRKTNFMPGLALDGKIDRDFIDAGKWFGNDCDTVVIVDGHFKSELSSIEAGSVEVVSIREALLNNNAGLEANLARIANEERAFVALNTALFSDGVYVRVPRGQSASRPIHLLCVSTDQDGPTVNNLRNLLIVEEGASATIVESHIGAGSKETLTNACTEVRVADTGRLNLLRLHAEGAHSYGIHNLEVEIGRDATFTAHQVMLGTKLLRNEAWARLKGTGGNCVLGGIYPLTGKQHVDNFTHVEHIAPHCESRQLYKGLLHGRSRGVFQGKVFVHAEAQKTNAVQRNPNIVLSPGAVADTKPQLEIYADDVKCTHGATVGKLAENPTQLFYMRSRGLSLADARQLLLRAFAMEVTADLGSLIGVDKLTEKIEEMVVEKLASFDLEDEG
jgi:Fe-S cluster assembly protein SufD